MIGERLLLLMGTETIPPELRKRAEVVAAARGLNALVDRPNVLCATDHRKVHVGLGATSAVVLGDIFARGSWGPALGPLRHKDLADGAETGGAYLIRRFWGGYIGLFFDESGSRASVMRAPFGRLAIYFTSRATTVVAGSSVDLVLEATDIRPSIDWSRVTHHLLAHQLRGADTCLEQVRELLPGFRMSAGRPEPEMVWNPADYCAPCEPVDAKGISRRLRMTIDSCVGAWAKTYGSVVLGVSGGLDSSVVAASAIAAGAEVACLTLATADPAGDERPFARELTDYLGTELYEFFEDPREIDLTVSAAAHLPRPTARAFAQTGDRRNLELAERSGVRAFFSGGGGDNVFCYLQSATIFVDVLRARGLSRQTWKTARDLATVSGVGLGEVIRRGFLRAVRTRREFAWKVDRSFLSAGVVAPTDFGHPWLDAVARLPPGKQGHVALLMNVQNHLDGFGREEVLPVISPLLSQPLVEFCLSVPTWSWIEGGINRAPARRAYANALPDSVLRRTSKGTPDPFVLEVFETHRGIIREMLLDGFLSQHGLLDRKAVDQAISRPDPTQGEASFRLLRLVDVEAWLRVWHSGA